MIQDPIVNIHQKLKNPSLCKLYTRCIKMNFEELPIEKKMKLLSYFLRQTIYGVFQHPVTFELQWKDFDKLMKYKIEEFTNLARESGFDKELVDSIVKEWKNWDVIPIKEIRELNTETPRKCPIKNENSVTLKSFTEAIYKMRWSQYEESDEFKTFGEIKITKIEKIENDVAWVRSKIYWKS